MSFLASKDMGFGLTSAKKPALAKKHSSLCRLEIRPDSDYILFRGRAGHTSPQTLKGRVVLMNTDIIDVKRITITLEGRWRTTYDITLKDLDSGIDPEPRTIRNNGRNHYDNKQLVTNSMKLPPSNHEFPFEFELPGDMCESVEGYVQKPVYQIYQLHANIERKFPHKDLEEIKHIRVIRSIDPDAYELLDPLCLSGFWPDKIKYEWSSMSKAVVYGGEVIVDFKLTPLVEKLEVCKIRFWIREVLHVKTNPSPLDYPNQQGYGSMWKKERPCATQELDPPEQTEEILDEELQIPMRKFSMSFQLPKSLYECRQTVEYGEWIQIKHHMHISVILSNADGHMSELRGHTPIKLYISPHLPIGHNQEVTAPIAGQLNSSLASTGSAPPPVYGNHTQDLPLNPFREIGPSGFVTPAGPSRGSQSGNATPRRAGTANDGSGITGSSNEQTPLPHQLLARLETLRSQSEEQSEQQANDQGTGSDDDAEHIEYNMNELGRVPTYNTAVNNPGPVTYEQGPPTYDTATSRPASPALAAPNPDHLRVNGTSESQG